MAETPLWRCPTCGQTFVSPGMPHSCAVVEIDDHFAASPALRPVFDAYLAAARSHGPVTVNATKSRISFQVRMRFAGVQRPGRRALTATFVLTRRIESPRLRVEPIAPYYYVHRLVLRTVEDVDDEVRGWLGEAYQVGAQRHLSDPAWPRERLPG